MHDIKVENVIRAKQHQRKAPVRRVVRSTNIHMLGQAGGILDHLLAPTAAADKKKKR